MLRGGFNIFLSINDKKRQIWAYSPEITVELSKPPVVKESASAVQLVSALILIAAALIF